jgi:hypothetical protein
MKSINTFWNWFQDNNQIIQNIVNGTPKNQKKISFWIDKHLKLYCKELDFILVFSKIKTNKSKMIITANGNPDYFYQVVNLVDNAPQLKNWKFTAFIQPSSEIEKIISGLDEPYFFQDITLKTSELKFRTLDYDQEKSRLDLIIHLKNYALHCDSKTLQQAIFIVIQDLLGEESLFQNINLVQLAQMPDNDNGLIHLYELQFYIDKINAFKKKIIKKG